MRRLGQVQTFARSISVKLGDVEAQVTEWIAKQPAPQPTLSEAIRILLQHALAKGGPKPTQSLNEQIASAKRKAATPVPGKPSPERGTAMLRKGKAEAGLAGLNAKGTTAPMGGRKGGKVENGKTSK